MFVKVGSSRHLPVQQRQVWSGLQKDRHVQSSPSAFYSGTSKIFVLKCYNYFTKSIGVLVGNSEWQFTINSILFKLHTYPYGKDGLWCTHKVPNTRPHYKQVMKCKASNQILVFQVLCCKELQCSRAQMYTILANFHKSICTEILHLITYCNY
jgi:hypothetical protein